MDEKISREARGEVLQAVQERYRHATKKEKTRVLDEVAALTGCHRKHAIRLLAKPQKLESQSTHVGRCGSFGLLVTPLSPSTCLLRPGSFPRRRSL